MTLFDPPDPRSNVVGKVRRDHPGTARAAAIAAMPRTGTARFRLLLAIAAKSGTDEALQDRISMAANTQRPRRVELVEGGWIEASDEVAHTRAGQAAIVWRVTDAGRVQLAAMTEPREATVGPIVFSGDPDDPTESDGTEPAVDAQERDADAGAYDEANQ